MMEPRRRIIVRRNDPDTSAEAAEDADLDLDPDACAAVDRFLLWQPDRAATMKELGTALAAALPGTYSDWETGRRKVRNMVDHRYLIPAFDSHRRRIKHLNPGKRSRYGECYRRPGTPLRLVASPDGD